MDSSARTLFQDHYPVTIAAAAKQYNNTTIQPYNNTIQQPQMDDAVRNDTQISRIIEYCEREGEGGVCWLKVEKREKKNHLMSKTQGFS